MKIIPWIILPLLFLLGCQTTNTLSPTEVEAFVDSQEQWLNTLQPKQTPMQVLKPVLSYQQDSFELLENNTIYQYVQGHYPVTNLLFGHYFEDGELVSLVLDQDVTDFDRCRPTDRHGKQHWLSSQDMGAVSNWFRQRNQLGGDFNRRARHPAASDDNSMSTADMFEAATYLPIIVIALPFYAADQIAGGMQSDSKMSKEAKYYVETASRIELKTSEDELLRLMGVPDNKHQAGHVEVWSYNLPAIAFGLVDKVILWKESLSTGIAQNTSSRLGMIDCGFVVEGE